MSKIIQLIFSISVIGLTGCGKTSQLCGGDDPGNDLPWLKQEISRLRTLTNCNSISRSTYKNQTAFIFSNCDLNSNSIPSLLNCNGDKLNLSNADYQNLKFTGDIQLIWKSN